VTIVMNFMSCFTYFALGIGMAEAEATADDMEDDMELGL
jgi:hypothetical protein